MLHVLYLLFNEGYATSSGPDLARTDLSGEAIRLARARARRAARRPRGRRSARAHAAHRRPAPGPHRRRRRAGPAGRAGPLAAGTARSIAEGVALITDALRRGQVGEYQVQAAIAAVHDQAARYEDTDWSEILVALRAARADDRQPDGHAQPGGRRRDGRRARTPASRCSTASTSSSATTTASTPCAPTCSSWPATPHGAIVEFRAAAARTTNLREQHYLTTKAARLATGSPDD